MKKCIVLLLCIIGISAAAQEFETGKTQQVFSFTPFSKNVSKVNGLAFGIGNGMRYLWDDEGRPVTMNGVNIEINPISPLIMLMADPERMSNDRPVITNNGLHIAVGGFLGNTRQNGVSVALFGVTTENNGVSVSAVYNLSKQLNGIHISGIVNVSSGSGSGVMIAPFNNSGEYRGLQLGVCNRATAMSWVQIGLVNKSKGRGFQMGLWNINGKRSLPFINF